MQNEISKKEIIREIDNHISEISKEFLQGFKLLQKYPKSVTFFGSSRTEGKNKYYKQAYDLSYEIVKKLKYTVITGGGPGIMEASNKGAKDAGGRSIGINIKLPREQKVNENVTESIEFNYFFVRKPLLNFAAECYIFFPGGFGTFDELFGVLTLIQTKKIPSVPVILFGSDFWNPFVDLIELQMLKNNKTIDADNMNIFTITDSIDEVVEIIKKSPVSTWWDKLD